MVGNAAATHRARIPYGGGMRTRADIDCWLTDMDGVLVHDNQALPGAPELIAQWTRAQVPFLVLTNNPTYTPRDLSVRLRDSGLDVPEDKIWTSALATAKFLSEQQPGGSCYVVGEAGLITALHEHGMIMTERSPEFVVVGETRTYSFESITTAIRLINKGARFIITNPDVTGPALDGIIPATGAVAALITAATGKAPYVIGKPNPMMFRSALNRLGAHSESTGMIGDRMDTDIVAGIEAGLYTVLVLSGISTRQTVEQFPFRPTEVLDGVFELVAK